MFQAPFFFQQAAGAGAPATAPVMSNRLAIRRTDTNQWGSNISLTTQAYTSGAGNVGVLGCTRSTAATTRLVGGDWNGDAFDSLVTAKQDGVMNLSCAALLKAGGLVGAGTLHFQEMPSVTSSRFRFLMAWAFDLDQVRGGVGAAAANVIAVTQDHIDVSLPVTQVGSLLVAAGWCQEPHAVPFTWSGGWAKLDEQNLGLGDQPCGSIATKVSTVTGAQTVTMTGDLTIGQWAIVAVEFLAG